MEFREIRIAERRAFGLNDLTRYQLFAPDFIEFLRRVMPPHRHAELVFSIVITASRPESAAPVMRKAGSDQGSPTKEGSE